MALLSNFQTSPSTADVLTYHYDNSRSGLNSQEYVLTPQNVNSNEFGLLYSDAVDGKVDANPLYVSSLNVAGQGVHNVLYVATEHDSVYAFDADTGLKLWQVSMLPNGETTSDDHGCNQISPEIGITSTPVIDRSIGTNGTIYVVAMSKDSTNAYHQRLHALDLSSGSETSSPTEISATYPGTGPGSNGTNLIFAPGVSAGQYAERAALLLLNGVIYTTWTSHCDQSPYTGWVIAYDEKTLKQVSVLNIDPTGLPTSSFLDDGSGNSFWMSGAGPAADADGNIFAISANGPFAPPTTTGGFPPNGDYGDSLLKFSTSNGLAVADYFTPFNQQNDANEDVDFGSGGVLLLPDMTDASGNVQHLAVGAGKDSNLYVVSRDNMGKYGSTSNSIYQELDGALPGGAWSTCAYFNNNLYYGPVNHALRCFTFTNAKLGTSPSSQSANTFSYPGSTPTISSNGTTSGIVWAYDNNSFASGAAILHAYNATNLATELYNSNQAASSRDHFGTGNKFITPMIANGKVYAPTTNSVAVFGLVASSASSELVATSAQLIPLPLNLTGTGAPTIEPRIQANATQAAYNIVVNFGLPSITAVSASLGLQAGQTGTLMGSVSGTVITQTASGPVATVSLIGVANRQRLVVHLTGIQPGNYAMDIPFGVLWGDTDGSGQVTSADITPIKVAYATTVGNKGYNVRADLNSDGTVSSVDIDPIKQYYTLKLP